jgi:hypothetical protein
MKHPVHGYELKDPQGRMSVQEIVRSDLEKHGRGIEFRSKYHQLITILNTPKFRMLREGNTLFLIHILDKGECQLSIINADTPKRLFRNIKGCYDALSKAGYHTIHTDSNIPNMVQAMRNMGMDIIITKYGKDGMDELTVRIPQ